MSDLTFEQRNRLETEVLPAVIGDPEYAASTIMRLETKIERLQEEITSLRFMVDDALAVLGAPGLDNDGGPADLANEIKCLLQNNTELVEEVTRLCDERVAEREDTLWEAYQT